MHKKWFSLFNFNNHLQMLMALFSDASTTSRRTRLYHICIINTPFLYREAEKSAYVHKNVKVNFIIV